MLTVTELAKQSGTTPHAVRYYTRRGLLRPQRDPENDYRLFQARDARWLRFVLQAKELGYTLAEIKDILSDADRGKSPCPRVREILQQHIVENRRRLEELMALQRRMEHALQEWSDKPNGVPDGHSVCHLIESFDAEETSPSSGG